MIGGGHADVAQPATNDRQIVARAEQMDRSSMTERMCAHALRHQAGHALGRFANMALYGAEDSIASQRGIVGTSEKRGIFVL